MTLENEMKNIKGRIREAIYAGKKIFIFDDWEAFVVRHTGMKCFSTFHFYSFTSTFCLSVYCIHNLSISTREQIVRELKKHTQECGGILHDT